jgi:WD40 repeat protein
VAAIGWFALEKSREAEDRGRVAMLEAHANALDVANESQSTGAQDDAVKMLQQLRPKVGAEDLRGFAWHLLWEPYQSYRDVVFVDGSLSHVSVSQDGTTMAIANSSRIATFWNLETGEKLGEMRHKEDKVTAVHYPLRAQIGLAALERRRMQEGFRVFASPANHLPGSLVEQRLWSASPSGEYVLATEYASAPHAVSKLTSNGGIEPLRNVSAMGRAHSWSNDSTLLATTDGERVQVERLRDGASTATFNLASKLNIVDLEFTPRNEIVVVGTRADGQQALLVLNMSMRKERLALDAPDATHSPAVALRFSPDGKRLAALFGKSTVLSPLQRSVVTCWDLETGKTLFVLDEKATRFATSIAFSPDSQLLATGSRDLGIRLWHADSGSMQRLVGFHHGMRLREGEDKRRHGDDAIVSTSGLVHGGVPFITFARNGTLLITGSGLNNTVRTWELASGRDRIALPEPLQWDQRAWLAVSGRAPGELAVLWLGAGMGTAARLWQAGHDRPNAAVDLHGEGMQGWAISPDGSRVAGVDADEALAIWPSDDPAKVARHRVTPPVANASQKGSPLASSQGIAFSPDGRLIASSSGRRTLVRNASGETNAILPGTAPLAFSADGSRLANLDACSAVQIWDVAGKKLLARLPLPDRCASALAVSPDGSLAVTVISGGIGAIVGGKPIAMVWDIESGRSWTLPDYDEEHRSVVVFSPDGRTLATVGKGGVVHLWHPRVARRPLALDGPETRVYHLAFSRDGRTLFALEQDGVRLVRTREEDPRMRAPGWGAPDEVKSALDKLMKFGPGR